MPLVVSVSVSRVQTVDEDDEELHSASVDQVAAKLLVAPTNGSMVFEGVVRLQVVGVP